MALHNLIVEFPPNECPAISGLKATSELLSGVQQAGVYKHKDGKRRDKNEISSNSHTFNENGVGVIAFQPNT